MVSAFDELLDWHTVQVRKFAGNGSNGPRYTASAPLACTVNEQTTTTVGPQGNITATTTTITVRPELADQVNEGALVTLPSGREAEVTAMGGATDLPGEFADLALVTAELT